MSFTKGDLLTRTRKLVKGLAKVKPVWIKVMEQIHGFDPLPARVFGQRVLQLKDLGVSQEDAITVADMEYHLEKKAYLRPKQITKLQGKRPPLNPYPSVIKEIKAEERKFVRNHFFDTSVHRILEQLKAQKAVEAWDRMGGARY